MTTPAEQEVTNAMKAAKLIQDAVNDDPRMLDDQVALAKIISRAAAAEGRAAAVDVQAVWDEAINLVKGLLPELERVNKVELEHGFIGTSYELGQTKDIIELLEAARDASPPTAPREPHEFVPDCGEPSCPYGLCVICKEARLAHQVSAPQREGE